MNEYRPYIIGIFHSETKLSQLLKSIKEELDAKGKKGMSVAIEIGTKKSLYPPFWRQIADYARAKGMEVIPLETDVETKFEMEKIYGIKKYFRWGLTLYLTELRDKSFAKRIEKKKPDIVITGYHHGAAIKKTIPGAILKPIPPIGKAIEKYLWSHPIFRTMDNKFSVSFFRARRKFRKKARQLKRRIRK